MKNVLKITEAQEMAALAEWVALHPHIQGLKRLFHISNEGPRNRQRAVTLLLRSGVSDYFLAVPKNGYAGLWIELKAKGGKPTPNQIMFLAESVTYGYMSALCYGWQEAVKVIEGYLGLRLDGPTL